MGQRWGELEAGTIAQSDFPVFKISLMQWQDDTWKVTANATTDKPNETPIDAANDWVAVNAGYLSGPAPAASDWSVFDTNGTKLDYTDESGNQLVTLLRGTNRLGIRIQSKPTPDGDSRWAAFAWLTVNCTNQGWSFFTLAGSPGVPGWRDGWATNALLNSPGALAVDKYANIYVADASNNVVRMMVPPGIVTTIAGIPGVAGSRDGIGTNALFNFPCGIAVDSNTNIYVADTYNNTIRKITHLGIGWWVTTVAGSVGNNGHQDGNGILAAFDTPNGLAVDGAGNVYVADTVNSTIRKMTPAGDVTTLAGNWNYHGYANGTNTDARFGYPEGVAVDAAGNVYVADTVNSAIRKVTPAGVVTTLAGSGVFYSWGEGKPGYADGMGSSALFGYPEGVAVDGAGNIYVADSDNDAIRKVTPSGMVTTLGGVGSVWQFTSYGVLQGYTTYTGTSDGIGTNAYFNFPTAIAVDPTAVVATNIYVVDCGNNTIRYGQK